MIKYKDITYNTAYYKNTKISQIYYKDIPYFGPPAKTWPVVSFTSATTPYRLTSSDGIAWGATPAVSPAAGIQVGTTTAYTRINNVIYSFYIISDSTGYLWVSKDNGKTWTRYRFYCRNSSNTNHTMIPTTIHIAGNDLYVVAYQTISSVRYNRIFKLSDFPNNLVADRIMTLVSESLPLFETGSYTNITLGDDGNGYLLYSSLSTSGTSSLTIVRFNPETQDQQTSIISTGGTLYNGAVRFSQHTNRYYISLRGYESSASRVYLYAGTWDNWELITSVAANSHDFLKWKRFDDVNTIIATSPAATSTSTLNGYILIIQDDDQYKQNSAFARIPNDIQNIVDVALLEDYYITFSRLSDNYPNLGYAYLSYDLKLWQQFPITGYTVSTFSALMGVDETPM